MAELINESPKIAVFDLIDINTAALIIIGVFILILIWLIAYTTWSAINIKHLRKRISELEKCKGPYMASCNTQCFDDAMDKSEFKIR